MCYHHLDVISFPPLTGHPLLMYSGDNFSHFYKREMYFLILYDALEYCRGNQRKKKLEAMQILKNLRHIPSLRSFIKRSFHEALFSELLNHCVPC
jgi:hypothetical protein